MVKKMGIIWQDFLCLEREMIEILNYIPYKDRNHNTFSPFCSRLILSSCSKLESFMKYMLKSDIFKYFKEVNLLDIDKVPDSEDRLDMGDYKKFYNSIYDLQNKIVIFKGMDFVKIIPFENWKDGTTPLWWNTYNNLKHNYFDNIEEGTLKEAVHSLSAYFLICVNHVESLNWLIHHTNAIKSDKPLEFLFQGIKTPDEIDNDWKFNKWFYNKESEQEPNNKHVKREKEYFEDDVNRNFEIFKNLRQWKSLLQPFKIPIRMKAESNLFIYFFKSPITYEFEQYLKLPVLSEYEINRFLDRK